MVNRNNFSKLKFHEGKIINGIEILEVLEIEGKANRKCKCKCHCGHIWNTNLSKVLSGNRESCGCIGRKKSSKMLFKHGKTGTRLYTIWRGIIGRCEFKYYKHYKDYGGRGIFICKEWKDDFLNFEKWSLENGYNDNLSIDRINVDGNYEPSNCRWANSKEQNRNRRDSTFLEFNGQKKNPAEWSEITGIKYITIKKRMQRGLSDEDCLKPTGYFRNRANQSAE